MIAQGYILAIAAAAAFATGGGLAWKYQGAKLETCEVRLKDVGEKIEEQNRAVKDLKSISDKATAAAQEADKRASEAEAKAKPQTEAKRAAIKANTGAQTCSAAIDAIRKGRP